MLLIGMVVAVVWLASVALALGRRQALALVELRLYHALAAMGCESDLGVIDSWPCG